MEKIDLNKLRSEINSRKTEQTSKDSNLGIEKPKKVGGREFLHKLMVAKNTMRSNEASEHVKTVARVSDVKNGNIINHLDKPTKPNRGTNVRHYDERGQLDNNQYPNSRNVENNKNVQYDEPDRMDAIFAEYERRLSEYNPQGKTMFSEANIHQHNPYQQNVNQQHQNTDILDNRIKSIMNEVMGESIVSAMREVIMEIFLTDKIKDGILYNKDTIKEIVIETIRDLQKKKK